MYSDANKQGEQAVGKNSVRYDQSSFYNRYCALKAEVRGAEHANEMLGDADSQKREHKAKKELQRFYIRVMQDSIDNGAVVDFLCIQVARNMSHTTKDYQKEISGLLRVVAVHKLLMDSGICTRLPTLEERLQSKFDLVEKRTKRPILCRWYASPQSNGHLAVYDSIAGFEEDYGLDLVVEDVAAVKIHHDMTSAQDLFSREPLLVLFPGSAIDLLTGRLRDNRTISEDIAAPLLSVFLTR